MNVFDIERRVAIETPVVPGRALMDGNGFAAVSGLRLNRLLGSLADHEFFQVISSGRWVRFRQDEVVSHQARPVDHILYIVEGRAKAEVSAPVTANSPFRAVVNLLVPGNDVGLLSLVDVALHSATVTALEDIDALSIPLSVMRSHLRSHPEWYRILAEIAVDRLRTSGLWLQALM